MRKIVLILLVFGSFSFIVNGQFDSEASAESLVSKNGHNILPEKGDVGLGINAGPFLDFIGNLTKINSGGSFNSPLHMEPPEGGMAICIKYFTGSKTAIRARFRIAYSASTEKLAVIDDTDPAETLYDTRISTNTIFDVGIGIEQRKGATRLQGLYGIEGMLSVTRGLEASPNYHYKYANEFSSSNPTPTTNLWGVTGSRPVFTKNAPIYGIGGRGFIGAEYFFTPKISKYANEFSSSNPTPTTNLWDGTTAPVGTRPIFIKNAPIYGIGGRGFIGAEYFFTPKISIGGELAIALQINRTGSSKIKTETYVTSVERDVIKDKSTSGSGLMLDKEADTHLFLVVYF